MPSAVTRLQGLEAMGFLSKLEAAAQRAKEWVVSNVREPAKVVASCPAPNTSSPPVKNQSVIPAPAPVSSSVHYEDCVLKELVLQLTDGAQSQDFKANYQRRYEAVAPTVYDAYKSDLRSHELVIEALANCYLGAGKKDLTASAQAFCSSRHVSFSPAHPRTRIGDDAQADGGAPVQTKIFIDDRSGMQSWLSIWPFAGERTRHITVSGSACGHTYVGCNVPPKPALANLAMRLVVMPHEKWSFKIKDIRVGYSRGGSASKSINAAANVATRAPFRSVTTTLTRDFGKRGGTSQSTTRGTDYLSQSNETKFSDGGTDSSRETLTTNTYSVQRTLSQDIGSSVYSVTQKDSLDGPTNVLTSSLDEDHQFKISEKFSLEVETGGEVAKFEPGAFVEGLYKVKDILDSIKDVLKACRVGAGVNADYKFLYGDLSLDWGYRWPVSPKTYKEENRVYYVERYISASGTLNVLTGSVGLWAGVDFDQGWLPAGVKALIEGSITATLKVSPTISLSATNLKTLDQADAALQVVPEFTIEPKFEGTGSVRVLGYRQSLSVVVEGNFEAKAKLAFSFRSPPSLKASVNWEGLTFSGYFYDSTRKPPRKDIEPVELAKPSPILKETEFWK